MTRINAGIPVQELTKPHLIAEHREITRIPNAIKSERANLDNIPTQFKLGDGHVKFFYDKLLYLKRRYINLYLECDRRNINVENKLSAFAGLPDELMGDYTPTERDKQLVRMRIAFRLREAEMRDKFKQHDWYLEIRRERKYTTYVVWSCKKKDIPSKCTTVIMERQKLVTEDFEVVERFYEKNFAEWFLESQEINHEGRTNLTFA